MLGGGSGAGEDLVEEAAEMAGAAARAVKEAAAKVMVRRCLVNQQPAAPSRASRGASKEN